MKKYIRQYQKAFGFILGSFFCSSFSIALIPWIDQLPETTGRIISYIVAAIFWLGLILGIVFTVIMNKNMRMVRGKMYERGSLKRPKYPGIILFSTDPVHIVIYAVMGCGIFISILDLIKGFMPIKLMFFIIFLTYDAIVLHSIVDGKNYKVYRIMKEGTSNENIQKKKTE